jgi:lysyl-tRNA synthetase class 2
MSAGLPDCAGVALGIDRLLMVAGQYASLADVIAFPLERA